MVSPLAVSGAGKAVQTVQKHPTAQAGRVRPVPETDNPACYPGYRFWPGADDGDCPHLV